MQRLADGSLVLAATDLTNHLACAHLTQQQLAIARGERAWPLAQRDDPVDEALERRLLGGGVVRPRALVARLRRPPGQPWWRGRAAAARGPGAGGAQDEPECASSCPSPDQVERMQTSSLGASSSSTI